MIKLDKTDREILSLLQSNSRITIKEMAEKLGLSSTPVFERIKKLEKEGVIDKYVVLLNGDKLDRKLVAFLQVSIKQHTKADLDLFLKHIQEIPEVMECYHVTGEFDFLLKIVVKDMKEYNEIIVEKMSVAPNLSKVHSLFALSTSKHTTSFSIPQ